MNNYQKIIFGILLILIFSCGRVNKDTPECSLEEFNHPEVFSAIAPVAGMMLHGFFDNCDSMNPIPVFSVFGTDDEVTNFNGDLHDEDGWGSYISIPSTIEYWAKRVDYDAFEISRVSCQKQATTFLLFFWLVQSNDIILVN